MYKWKFAIYLVTSGFKSITPILTCCTVLESFPFTEPGVSEIRCVETEEEGKTAHQPDSVRNLTYGHPRP